MLNSEVRTAVKGKVILTAVAAAVPVFALQYSAAIGSTAYGFNTVAEPAETRVQTFTPLRFNLNHGTGFGTFAFIGNGRLFKEFGSEAGVNGRVYYGYLRWRAPGEWLIADFGRQYIAAAPTAATVDGARAVIADGQKWRADLFGGMTVRPDFGAPRRFSRPAGEPFDDPNDHGYWQDNYVYGAHGGLNLKEVWAAVPFPMWFGAGGGVTKKAGHLSSVRVAVDGQQDPRPNIKMNEEVHYDHIGRRIDYQYYAVRWRPWPALKTYADYRWKEPRIDYGSLFSVFAREATHRWRAGAQYKIKGEFQPFADYGLVKRGADLSHRVRAGLDQDFGFTFLHYGGLYGKGERGQPGGDEYGAFAGAEFPRPIPAWEAFSAGTSAEFIRYKEYGDGITPLEWEDVFFYDLHGRLNFWRYFETTVGTEVLANEDRRYEVRAYVTAGAAISR